VKRSDINPMPQYYGALINLIPDVELQIAFDESVRQLDEMDRDLLTRLDNRKYAPNKWTVKEIIQHITDFERILGYRALLFARREPTTPQDIDQMLLAENSNANRRTIGSLLEELKCTRLGTKSLFDGFDNEALLTKGISWNYEISVLAMGFTIIGHQVHHLKVIEERYYPLL
jgi:hypothetical protein